MLVSSERYITDSQGKQISVILDIATYHELLAAFNKVHPQKATTSTTENNYDLEPFIGMWSDWTEEEDQVFQEIVLDRSHYFNRPTPDLG